MSAVELVALADRLRNFEGSDALGNGDFSLLREAADALAARPPGDGWVCVPREPTWQLRDPFIRAYNGALLSGCDNYEAFYAGYVAMIAAAYAFPGRANTTGASGNELNQ